MADTVPENGNTFREVVSAYLDLEAVDAAALVTKDGLLIASAGEQICDFETLGALAAPALSIARELAMEFGDPAPRLVSLSLSERGLLFAPLSPDVFLILVGGTDVLSYSAAGAVSL